MDTVIIRDINDESMACAGKIIRDGGIVAFPTETVYGLGASAYNDDAVKKIYKAKGRPSDNPLIVHLADVSEISKAAREVPESAQKLFDKFAPGPFTVILKKQPGISDTVTAGLDTVGVRIPQDLTARAFIKAAGVPIAAPSANISGKPSPTCAEHVLNDMTGRADAIICGGRAKVGVESTIIDCTGEVPVILRPGGITLEDVIAVCGSGRLDKHVLSSVAADEQPKCPGMKYKHYAPDADVTVVEGGIKSTEKEILRLVKEHKDMGEKVGVLTMSSIDFGADLQLSSGKDNRDFARCLFGALREFDERKIDTAFVQFCIGDSYGLAVKNRLYKSAGNKIIYTEKNI